MTDWKTSTCETCEFCVRQECRINPPVAVIRPQFEKSYRGESFGGAIEYPWVDRHSGGYQSACSKYQQREGEP